MQTKDIKKKNLSNLNRVLLKGFARKTLVFLMIAALLNNSIFLPMAGLADSDKDQSFDGISSQTFAPQNVLAASTPNSFGSWKNLEAGLKAFDQNDLAEGLNGQNSAYLTFSNLDNQIASTTQTHKGLQPATSTFFQDMVLPEATDTVGAILPQASRDEGFLVSTSTVSVQDNDVELAPELGQDVLPADNVNIGQQSGVDIPGAILQSTTTDSGLINEATSTGLSELLSIGQDEAGSAATSTGGQPSGLENFISTTTVEDNVTANKILFSPDLEFSGFSAATSDESGLATSSLINAKIKIALSGPSSPGAFVSVQYAVANSSWQDLGTIKFDVSQPQNPGKNFEFALPDSAVGDVGKLAVKFVYHGFENSLDPAVYINALGIEGQYANFSSLEEDISDWSLQTATSTFTHLDFQNRLLDLSLPDDLSNPITIGRKGQPAFGIALKSVNNASVPIKSGNQITYPDALLNTDLQYQLKDTGLKENIILKNKNHPQSFKYLVDTSFYDVTQVAQNTLKFYKKGRKNNPLLEMFTLSAPVMTDASGQISNNLSFKLKGSLLTLVPDLVWLRNAKYPVTIDPNVDISVLNVSSFPVAGGYWTIDFTTLGAADFSVTPADQDTVNDMEFSLLTCDGNMIATTLQADGKVFSSNWSCPDGLGEIKFLDKKTGHHQMVFNFGGVTKDAYNGANVWNGNAGDSKWETNGNWSTGAKPIAGDDVVIGTAATININGSASVGSLTVGNSGGGVASVLNFNYDAIANGALTTAGNLIVYGGASVTHTVASSTGAVVGKIKLTAGGNATITGSVNADAKGYAGGQGPGAGMAGGGGGGASYGGLGSPGNTNYGTAGTISALAGNSYGSSTNPTDLGSGGGIQNDTLANGGGAIMITVTGTTTISGSISANGSGLNHSDGGGSGGTVNLTTAVLAGNGNIYSKGGDGGPWSGSGGGGGGGRIAINYTTDSSTISYSAQGGSFNSGGGSLLGGAGTIFKKTAAQTYGDVTVDNNNQGGASYQYFGQTAVSSTTLDNLYIKNSASVYLAASSATSTIITISNNGLYDAKSGTNLKYSSLTWTGGNIIDSGGSFAVLGQNQDLTVPTGSTLVQNFLGSSRTYNNVTINGTLTHSANTNATSGTASLYKINWTINGNLNLAASGSINADAKGFIGKQGPGAGASINGGGGGGGSYGGIGGTSSGGALPGVAYGSLTVPTDLGSGGGANNGDLQSAGGGAILLAVTGTTTISGIITNKGYTTLVTAGDGGGSGGSVYIVTNGLAGDGSINASGSNSVNWSGYAGAGGGGRVAVYYTTDISTISYSAGGGQNITSNSQFGAPGTVYKKASAQTYGDLIIDNNNLGGSDSRLFPQTPIGSLTFDNVTLQNSGAIYLNASSATTTTLTLSNNGYYEARNSTRLNYTNLNIVTAGIVADSGGTMPLIDQNTDLLVPTNLTLIMNAPGASRTYYNITINGALTHAYNTGFTSTTPQSSLYKIDYTATGNLTINAGGSVNVNNRGYDAGVGPGSGAYNSGVGGSYGGLGGVSTYSTGGSIFPVYGSSTAPTDLGSGGSYYSTCTGSSGGGAVKFTVQGNSVINGSITSNSGTITGNCGYAPGAASGGSIYIISSGFRGTGSLTANGGDTYYSGCCNNGGGGGGGGRIAVSFVSNTGNAVSRSVVAGMQSTAQVGAVGTLAPQDSPTVTTQMPTSIADTSVTGHGTITSINYYPVLQYGNVIAQTLNPTVANSISTSALGATNLVGAFSSPAMIGLTHDTSYHTRAYITTAGGTVYGSDVAFITDAPAVLNQQDFRFYQNANSIQPAGSIGGQNVPVAIYTTSTPIRLVMNVGVTSDFLPAGVGVFKLQVSTATSTNWVDVGYKGSTWWNNSWQDRRKITFSNASSSSDLLNFPVLVSLNATSSHNIDYSKTKNGGADVRFVASDNTTALPYQIEKWDTSATSTAWVKVPNIHAASTTDFIYMYYNNPAATDNSSSTAVWDTNYYGVWHMNNTLTGSGQTVNDSTAKNNATSQGFWSAGQQAAGIISGSLNLNGTDDYMQLPAGFADFTNGMTLDFWVYPTASPSYSRFMDFANGSGNNNIIFARVGTTNSIRFEVWNGGTPMTLDVTGAISLNQWQHFVGTLDTNKLATVYKNGVVIGTTTFASLTPNVSRSLNYFGKSNWADPLYQGSMDESRISSVARSGDYILAEYKNDSGSFITYATDESMALTVSPAAWQFYSNSGVARGSTISNLLLSTSNVPETYEENNPAVMNPNQISAGQYGEWDFSLSPQNAVVNSTYYFRMVHSDGTVLDAYSNFPSVMILPDNAPNVPTNLGPSTVVNGGIITSNVPNFTFNLSDPDATDTVSFNLQISTSSSFSTLVTDYISALQAQGAASFAMGQSAGGGSYPTGSAGQTLPDGNYYWRVLATDLHGVSSAFANASSTGIAFTIQTPSSPPPSSTSTPPSPGGGGGGIIIDKIPSTTPPTLIPPVTPAPTITPSTTINPGPVPIGIPKPIILPPVVTPPVTQNQPPVSGSWGGYFSGSSTPVWLKTVGTVLGGPANILAAFVSSIGSAISKGFKSVFIGALIVVTGLAAMAAESVAISQGLLWRLENIPDVWWALLRFWYGLLGVLGLRKKRRRWGTVYDSRSKQPLDPVIVELIDYNSKRVVEQSISDINGRFGFLDKVGKYFISAKKTNYLFPSKIITGGTDIIYENLYHGEVITVNDKKDVITPNIPMDPLAFDWNQQDKLRIVKFNPKLEIALTIFFDLTFFAGGLYTVIALISNFTVINIILAVLYGLFTVAKILLPKPRLWGRIKSNFRNVGAMLVELCPEKIPNITLIRANSLEDGVFFLKAPPGKYVLKVTDKLSKTVVYTKNVEITEEGIFNKTLRL